MNTICDDLLAELLELDALVASLDETEWSRDTPAVGWEVRDQISHLWFFDQRALLALIDPDEFAADARRLVRPDGGDASLEPGRATTGTALLESWRADRARLLDVARRVDPASRVPWYGPAMSARSFITARLMETWAHGQDVFDALGVSRAGTDRLRHVAHIGVAARPFSYRIRGLEPPTTPVHVSLRGPDGTLWQWGEPAADTVSGEALEFCLVVTQRRHLLDTSLEIIGDTANEWMSIAQAFAGRPGPGREPTVAE